MRFGRFQPLFRTLRAPLLFGAAIVSLWPIRGLGVDTQTLPRGRNKLGIIFARTSEIRDTYDGEGTAASLVAPYQLELSSGNFRRAEPRLSELVSFLNNLPYRYDVNDRATNNGVKLGSNTTLPQLGDALSRGSLGLDAFARREQWAFKLQHGFTEHLSAGLALQVIQQSVVFRTQIGGINTASDIYSQLGTSGGSGQLSSFDEALKLLAQLNTENFQQILASKGYERFGDSAQSGMGDLILGGRYRWLDRPLTTGRALGALETRLALPTGSLARPSQLTGTDLGSGAWSLQIGHNTSFRPRSLVRAPWASRLEFYHYLLVAQNFPYERVRRIRTSPSDFLPDASTEEPVTVALGNSWTQTFGVTYDINPTLTFNSQLEWFHKNADRYLTAGPDTTRADYLAAGTEGSLSTLQFGLTASAVGSFFRGGMPLPGDLWITWNQPISGKNQLIAPYAYAELALYF